MKKIILAIVLLTTFNFSAVASTNATKTKVEQLVENAHIIQESVTHLATDLAVKSVVLSTTQVIEYVSTIESLLNQENLDLQKIQESFDHMKALAKQLESSWKIYQERTDPIKKELLASYNLNEKFIEDLIAASDSLAIDSKI
jgi:hypothetical protein